jgi:hypothetical protein
VTGHSSINYGSETDSLYEFSLYSRDVLHPAKESCIVP